MSVTLRDDSFDGQMEGKPKATVVMLSDQVNAWFHYLAAVY